MHLILQPLLLRRIKADVEHLLPKKREYVLYAPMTQEQTDLYNVINDKNVDTRQYLEDKVVERLTGATNTPAMSRKASPKFVVSKPEESDSEEDIPSSKLAIKKRGRGRPPKSAAPKNAFEQMMQKKTPTSAKGKAGSLKRKSQEPLSSPITKSTKSSRQSTPASSVRGRKISKRKSYTEADSTDDDELSDDQFEQKLAEEIAAQDEDQGNEGSPEEIERAKTLELASKLPLPYASAVH